MAKVRYTYRLRPGKQAEHALLTDWDRCRFVWNMCIQRDTELRAEGIRVTGYDLCKELVDWRGRYEWLAEGRSVTQQQMIRDWWSARLMSFKCQRQKPPKFKSRRASLPSLNYTRKAFAFSTDRKLVLGSRISLPVVWSRELPATPSSVRIYRDAVGHWWASFVVDIEDVQLSDTDKSIGIDWGLKAVATTTDPQFDLPHSRHGRISHEKLARYQRVMSRRRPKLGGNTSNGYKQARKRVAKLHRHTRWQRSDAAKKWAKKIVDAHDQIAIENFKPAFMAKSRRTARVAADAGIGLAKDELIRRARAAGRTVILVPPNHTTMTCSNCLTRAKQKLKLTIRIFRCDHCGHTEDRDRNAAKVILATAGFNRACVEDVSPEALAADGSLSMEDAIGIGTNQDILGATVA